MTEPRKRKRGGLTGETLGGMLAGFDQQIMRNLPPPHELVQKGAPVRGLSGEDGGTLTITLPPVGPPGVGPPGVDPPEVGPPGVDRSEVDPPAPGITDAAAEESSMPSTSDLMDERPGELDVCELQMLPFGALRRFAGRVRTVRCREDNVLLRDLLASPGLGDVLVVDGGGSMRTALMGDQVAGLAVTNGWAGIVIHGCIRDVEALARLPIGIRALGSNPRKSAKAGTGEVDVPVSFGGATFTPGATLTCDEDGIVVTRVSTEP